MAGTTTASRRTQVTGSDVNDLLIQFNAAVADLDALRTTLNAVITAAATNIGAVAAVTPAATVAAAKIGNSSGTAITS